MSRPVSSSEINFPFHFLLSRGVPVAKARLACKLDPRDPRDPRWILFIHFTANQKPGALGLHESAFSGIPHYGGVKFFKMAVLPTHHSRNFHPIPVNRSGLRLREKYVLMLIFIAFLLLCFGAFFFVPDLRDRTYLEDAYKRFVGARGDILPIMAPKTPIVKQVAGGYPTSVNL